MRFDKYLPADLLRPYVRYFAVSEQEPENEYQVFPVPGLVIGFQYRGHLYAVHDGAGQPLAPSGVTGVSDSLKVFRNASNTGTVLVYFTETGFARFTDRPVHELSGLSVPLDDIFERSRVAALEEQLMPAQTDRERISLVETFLLSQLQDGREDRLVAEAVRLIRESSGNIRIGALREQLFISASPFEKRFRQVVGTGAKKFASIVRFQAVWRDLETGRTSGDLCYEHDFFDQAHFIKVFRQFTGGTPGDFRRRP